MKKIMIMVAAIMLTASANASNKIVEQVDKLPNRMEPFTEVNVSVPARIRVVQGPDYGVLTQTAMEVDSSKLDYKVKDGVLYISSNFDDMLSATSRETVITIITPVEDARISTGTDFRQIRSRR